jgi:hypothetical protein
VDNSEISENHLKAIVGWLQGAGTVRVRQVPICRQGKHGAKGKRGKAARSRLADWGGECQSHGLAGYWGTSRLSPNSTRRRRYRAQKRAARGELTMGVGNGAGVIEKKLSLVGL